MGVGWGLEQLNLQENNNVSDKGVEAIGRSLGVRTDRVFEYRDGVIYAM